MLSLFKRHIDNCRRNITTGDTAFVSSSLPSKRHPDSHHRSTATYARIPAIICHTSPILNGHQHLQLCCKSRPWNSFTFSCHLGKLLWKLHFDPSQEETSVLLFHSCAICVSRLWWVPLYIYFLIKTCVSAQCLPYTTRQLTIANFDRVQLSVISIRNNLKTSSNFD